MLNTVTDTLSTSWPLTHGQEEPWKDGSLRAISKHFISMCAFWCLGLQLNGDCIAENLPTAAEQLIQKTCVDCHSGDDPESGLDLSALSIELSTPALRDQWILIHDRIAAGEMPPDAETLPKHARQQLITEITKVITRADRKDVLANGRGPLRRLTREEFEQNLRDILKLPTLDIQDMLPEERVSNHINRTASVLDMSRVQLAAYLNAADAALHQAMTDEDQPPSVTKYRAIGTQLFPANNTFGQREAMFFAKDNQAVAVEALEPLKNDPTLELALFRSAHWPYFGYPRGFVAKIPGQYRVRFSARAVLQTKGHAIKPANASVPMTFRARKPSGPDVSGDVRATGGIIDIQPDQLVYETIIRLKPKETFEYSLLGLPVPLARNVNGGPPTYRYPPFPENGQPGVAFQWLEIEGPLPPASWPPPSHAVLFDDLDASPDIKQTGTESRRLLERFIQLASRAPVPEEAIDRFHELIQERIQQGSTFHQAMLTGYKAFLCSSHFLYLQEPSDPATGENDQYAIAARLSHFLTNTRPDENLLRLAAAGRLRDRNVLRLETDRLIESPEFERFVDTFTDYWLDLRNIRRDEPDIRLHPEYRFDDYLIESMERETRTFFAAMIRDNLPAAALVDTDFVYANDRLSRHYNLAPLIGSKMQKVKLPLSDPRGGLLTQAAIMKVTANGTSTSPVVRGAWIMDRLLGQPPPPPPKNVPAVEPDIRGAKTIRQQLALHTKSESCANCHAKFDPIGMALENFDILGHWQTHYRATAEGEKVSGIDRAGHDFSYTVAAPVDSSGMLDNGTSFNNIHDLKTALSKTPRPLARNLLQQFTVYATGAPVRFSERPQVESMLDTAAKDGYRVRDLIHALVQSRLFLGGDSSQ